MKIPRLLSLLSVFLMIPAAQAGQGDEALRRFVDGVQSLSAAFEQVQIDERGNLLSQRSGSFELSRPGRFRWSYESPYQQLMVCDGKRIWNYEPDLQQATVRDAEQVLRGTPAALLAQRSLLGDAFSVESGGSKDGVDLVLLKPRGDADFQKIELWLAGGVPQRMKFYDALGGQTDVRFSKIRTGVAFDAARFSFTPPKGTEIVDDGKRK